MGGLLENCKILNNVDTADSSGNYGGGGGAINSILHHCQICNNISHDDGGGVASCVMYDCLVFGNHADNRGGSGAGGGIKKSIAIRTTIAGNTAVRDTSGTVSGGAGISSSVLSGCIVWGNCFTDGTADSAYSCSAT